MKPVVFIVLSIVALLIMLWYGNRKDEEKKQKKELAEKWAKDHPEELSRIMNEKMDKLFPDKKPKDEQKQ